MIEKWKIINSHPDYMVSNQGRVKSMSRIVNYTNGGKRPLESSILKPGYNLQGYPIVTLINNKKRKTRAIHRLVIMAFIPNPENKPMTNHKNGIKTDNYVENLEWATAKENVIHAVRTGLNKAKQGEYHYNSTITNKDVLKIRGLLN